MNTKTVPTENSYRYVKSFETVETVETVVAFGLRNDQLGKLPFPPVFRP